MGKTPKTMAFPANHHFGVCETGSGGALVSGAAGWYPLGRHWGPASASTAPVRSEFRENANLGRLTRH